MRIPSLRPSRFALVITLAAVCAFAPDVRAQWGSLRANNRAAVRRYQNFEPERRYAYYWAGFSPGMVVRRLPAGYVQTSVGTTGYYYYDGVYLRPTTDGTYEVVPPPLGATVPQLPDGAATVPSSDQPPITTREAPSMRRCRRDSPSCQRPRASLWLGCRSGAAPVIVNGRMYYVAGDNYFIPVDQGGETAYVTAQPPRP